MLSEFVGALRRCLGIRNLLGTWNNLLSHSMVKNSPAESMFYIGDEDREIMRVYRGFNKTNGEKGDFLGQRVLK